METKKLTEKINQQQNQIQKLKSQNSEVQEKYDILQDELKQQGKDLDQAEREKRKQV